MSPRRRLPAALMAAPAVLIASFVVLGGLLTAAAQSLGLLPLAGRPSLTVEAYTTVAPDLPSAVGLSLAIAAASTIAASAVGFTAALIIVQGRWCGRVVAAVSTLTIPFPHIVGAASVGLLLSDSGLLSRLTGAGEAWPRLVGGPLWFAVIADYSWKESAFVALVVTGALITRSAGYDETAALLGAGRLRRLRHVLLPLSLPALIVSATIVFVYTFGSYEVAWLLGRPYPEPLPVMALRVFGSASLTSRPEAAALAMVTTIVAFAAASAVFALLRKIPLWR
ncbi:ABC transporter permease subunit [Arthrobacter sp. CG_A4]|uniref:ABC transporter permease subunit n=1 Tax=Arthrobacter sp. CG_A4 TaxID=3071706 RepID=UPI002E05F2D8|nr:putative spermidine/putrescine transport system permease protein [Arthrobacter sp. CG_A4]